VLLQSEFARIRTQKAGEKPEQTSEPSSDLFEVPKNEWRVSMPIVGRPGETEAQIRNRAKERVRQVKRALHDADTSLEVLERRLDKILERKTLVQAGTFESYLQDHDVLIDKVERYTRTLIDVLTILSTFF